MNSPAQAGTLSYYLERHTLATPNYGYEKRQRELAKKKKKEEKLLAKSQRKPDDPIGQEGEEGAAPASNEGAADQGTNNAA